MNTASFRRRLSRSALAAVAAALLLGADGPGATPSGPPAQGQAATRPLADGIDPEVAKALEESWPDRPEWVDMLADILQGSTMGPDSGWFRTAVTQTRFGWDSTRKRLDRDGDGRIARGEFSGPDADFARLDRDRDGVLAAADFDFSAHALTPSPGLSLFYRADTDGNGKVTREEFDALFRSFDGGGQGFLSQSDMIDALTPRPRPAGSRAEAARGAGEPSKATLVRGLFQQEIGSLQPGPKLDEVAPDFTLKANDGKGEVTLSKLVGPRPVVLIFGNFTCGPFRSQAGNFEKLYRRYKDRATFVMVYVREAHPTDGWRMESNDRAGVATKQPTTYDERAGVAQACGLRLQLGFPMLVDTIDDRVGSEYSGMPGRFYLIDREGKVAFKNGRGPFGFKPAELEQSLILLLQQEATAAGANHSRLDRSGGQDSGPPSPRAGRPGGRHLPVPLVGGVLPPAVAIAEGPREGDRPAAPPSGAAFLERAWPGHPEWLAMLVDIFVVGDRMGGNDGWFRKAVARTRFDWKATRSTLDRDGDGTVARAEFAGPDADFARLDRDRDGILTSADFDFSAQGPSPGAVFFSRADRDGNGKVDRAELEAAFRAMDGDGIGFLSQGDLLQAFAPPAGPAQVRGGPTRLNFLKSFVREELGAFPQGPDLDEPAPDFTLTTVDGGEEVTLSKVIGPRPVVLVFGNFTCGPFRAQAGNIEKLARRYGDRATFLMVYVREAHPTDGWRMQNNDRVGVAIPQPRTDVERRSAAQACSRALGLGIPMLVDTVDDAVNNRYSGIPSRFYLIDRRGTVAFKSGRGPFGFKPAELEQSLILLLDRIATEDAARAASGAH